MIAVGIDPGYETGFAVWNSAEKKLIQCKALRIHRAFEELEALRVAFGDLAVIFEDARLRTWFGAADARQRKYGAAIREGVGSVKRDCVIWHDYLTDHGYAFVNRKPTAGGTKWPAANFARATGWTERTNEHGRDAAMLVFGLPLSIVQSIAIERDRNLKAATRAHASAHP